MPVDIELSISDNSNHKKNIKGVSKSELKSYFTNPGLLSRWSFLKASDTVYMPDRSNVIFAIYHDDSNSEWNGKWNLRCWRCPGSGAEGTGLTLGEIWQIVEPSIPSNTGGRRRSRRRRNRSQRRSYRK